MTATNNSKCWKTVVGFCTGLWLLSFVATPPFILLAITGSGKWSYALISFALNRLCSYLSNEINIRFRNMPREPSDKGGFAKKAIMILLFITIGGYLVDLDLKRDALMEKEATLEAGLKAEKDEARRKQLNSLNNAVDKMISRTNASDDWEDILCNGDKGRMGPILSIELERIWVQHGPILFHGTIKDIESHDKSNFKILIQISAQKCWLINSDLYLSLIANKEKIESLLEEHPDMLEFPFWDEVALVANIANIRAEIVKGDDGESENVKIGDGELVDIIYTGGLPYREVDKNEIE